MEILDICVQCGKPSRELDFNRMCPVCFEENKWKDDKPKSHAPYFKEMGVENPVDPKGSTAHVRDIKQRRYDPKTDSQFKYEPPKSYFFPKGKGD